MAATDRNDDAVRAAKFMAVKAGVFILVPLVAALIAVWWRFS